MLYGKYLISCIFESEAILPHFKGSTFRGAFGGALKSVVCALRKMECEECLLNTRCLYIRFFEAGRVPHANHGNRRIAKPHPFVIEPPFTSQTDFPPGSTINFNLILFGEENRNLGYFIYALAHMGKGGVGKKINGRRGSYRLQQVVHGDSTIYAVDEEVLKLPENIDDISPADLVSYDNSCRALKIDIITPVRLKYQNRLSNDLPFHVLVRAMLRRISSLFEWYGGGEPELDYKGLVHRAREVRVQQSKLKWLDWRRYSNRQETAMLMGGITGSIVYEGALGEFIPLVEFCRKVHVGKQTTFGLGKIDYEILE